MKPRKPRKRKIGVVTSDRMEKTIAVRVDWLYKVPKYGKRVRRHTTYYAHDEGNLARTGDEVEIVATRPLSKLKRWRLARIIRRAGEKAPREAAARPEPGPAPDRTADQAPREDASTEIASSAPESTGGTAP